MFNLHDDEFISQATVSSSQVKVCTSSRRLVITVTFQPQAADRGDSLYMPKPPYNKPYLSIYCELIKGVNMYIRNVLATSLGFYHKRRYVHADFGS